MQFQTQTKVITEHVITLSDSDLDRYMQDPNAFRDDILLQKNGGGRVDKRRSLRRAKPHVSVPKALKTRKAIVRVACQMCGVLIAEYKQGKHKCKRVNGAKSDLS